jgi:hypothetical protein
MPFRVFYLVVVCCRVTCCYFAQRVTVFRAIYGTKPYKLRRLVYQFRYVMIAFLAKLETISRKAVGTRTVYWILYAQIRDSDAYIGKCCTENLHSLQIYKNYDSEIDRAVGLSIWRAEILSAVERKI